MKDKYRQLPAVGKLLQHPAVKAWQDEFPLDKMSQVATKMVDEMRTKIADLLPEDFLEENIIKGLRERLEFDTTPNFQYVINATGVVLHTNLGRALLSKEAVAAMAEIVSSYNNLELNLDTGKRGSRYSHVEKLICELTGAEAALVVNNNASAVLLVLRELAQEEEVIVSRGELVEIGGSFRVSEVMRESRGKLVEVGTTNKTHIYDYERNINENTRLLLKVHTSNFRVVGFTETVSSEELVKLGNKYDLPVYEDLGSGMLYDLKNIGIGDEPTVQEVVAAGVDVISFSGDKLLGGPQAGIIVGKKKYIDKIKMNQLNRALRIDKFTIAALERTLLHYVKEEYDKIPTLQMLTVSQEVLGAKAEKLARLIQDRLDQEPAIKRMFPLDIRQEADYSQVGGGALPLERLATQVISLGLGTDHASVAAVTDCLRHVTVPLIPRVSHERIILDVRTMTEAELDLVANSIIEALAHFVN